MNLNRNQIIAIVVAVLSVLMGSTAQLTDLFGPGITKTIISTASLLNSGLSAVLAVITGQGGMVRDVAAMEGVTKISVNSAANSTLASVAVDPLQPKVGADSKTSQPALQEIAKG